MEYGFNSDHHRTSAAALHERLVPEITFTFDAGDEQELESFTAVFAFFLIFTQHYQSDGAFQSCAW